MLFWCLLFIIVVYLSIVAKSLALAAEVLVDELEEKYKVLENNL